jgi:hypothetical protein
LVKHRNHAAIDEIALRAPKNIEKTGIFVNLRAHATWSNGLNQPDLVTPERLQQGQPAKAVFAHLFAKQQVMAIA